MIATLERPIAHATVAPEGVFSIDVLNAQTLSMHESFSVFETMDAFDKAHIEVQLEALRCERDYKFAQRTTFKVFSQGKIAEARARFIEARKNAIAYDALSDARESRSTWSPDYMGTFRQIALDSVIAKLGTEFTPDNIHEYKEELAKALNQIPNSADFQEWAEVIAEKLKEKN